MFVDAISFGADHTEHSEVCIFGSGPAGMALAYSLASQGTQVLLIEAGGLTYEDWSQELYRGQVIGDTYYDLSDARLRMFGGTSNHWGGRCIPLEAHDFEAHPHFENTGWPITRKDIDPYLQAACDIVEIPNAFSDSSFTSRIRKTSFHYSPPVLFGEKYMEFCSSSPNIRTCLETALTDLQPEGQAISLARVTTRGGGSWTIKADTFVMCLGGIENSRMLLWMDANNNNALNGNRDVLGSYWMEHPHAHLADVLLEAPGIDFFRDGEATFALSRAAQFEAGVLNAGLELSELAYSRTKSMVADVFCVAPALGERLMHGIGKSLVCGARLESHWEQAPVRSNRVRLGATRDALGIPQTELYWQRSTEDRATIVETIKIFADELASHDRGRARLAKWVRNNALIPDDNQIAGWHHMGGTRMSDDPARGVVDKNLKVHGLGNLYIGGSSVFPSGGYANPTLTIIQMSLRLAEHLRQSVLTL